MVGLGHDVSVNSLLETWPLRQKKILCLEKVHHSELKQLLPQLEVSDEGVLKCNISFMSTQCDDGYCGT